MNKIWSVLGFICSLSLIATGQDFMITSFPGNGTVVWEYPTNGVTSYRVEWASQAGGPWTDTWNNLRGIAPTGMTMAAAVPMFYRVMATVTNLPAPDGMVLIPAGTNSGIDPDFGAYSLAVGAHYVDRTEVTKAQWDVVYSWAVVNGYGFGNAGSGKASDHPVQMVDWYDCVKWCNARSEREGRPVSYRVGGGVYRSNQEAAVSCDLNARGYRLPTMLEWEYAARGGASGQRFPWGDTIDHNHANYSSLWSGGEPFYSYDTGYEGQDTRYSTPGGPYTAPVGSFVSNGFGLYDMAGNVDEWCWDRSAGSNRVICGGNWLYYAEQCRSAGRVVTDPANAMIVLGFRAVLPALGP